jgi:molybdenum cofactor cytidylyltransferase
MLDGIVLAGGYSSRFNKNKMCVDYKGLPLIVHTILTMHEVCEKIYVVTGHYHDEIKEVLRNYDYVETVYNRDYALGMFSSVKAGVTRINHNFFLIPGDYPLLGKEVYEKLLLGKEKLRVPSFEKHLGHPLYFDFSLKKEILNTKATNLKAYRDLCGFEIIDVDDPFILKDIDTEEDFLGINGKE